MKKVDIEGVRNPIVYISIAIMLGSVFWGFYKSEYIWLAALAVSLFFIIVLLKSNFIFLIIIFLFFALSLFNNFNYYNLKLKEEFNGEIQISEVKSYYTIGKFKGRLINIEGGKNKFKIGDKIRIEGKFQENLDFERGIIGTIKISEINNVSDSLRRKLYRLREKVYEKLKENVGERKSALLCSMAFGYSDNIDEADREEMQNLGVIHVISVSGLHVALIYSILKKLFGIRFSLLLTVGYVMLTGAAFSSIRALIMISLLSLAVIVRKTYNPLAAISFSAGIITLFNPYAPFKTGFQLSFLAALGIILFSKSIKRKLYRLPEFLNDTISISLSAQVLTLPIMLIQFGQCSIFFMVGNLILVPIMNLLIYIGNIMLIAVYIPEVFDFLSYIVMKLINLLDNITLYFDLFLKGSIFVNKSVVILYCFILISFFLLKYGKEKAKFLPLSAMIIFSITIYSPVLKIDYLGKGSILVSYRGERKIVSNARNVDMKKLKEQNIAEEGYRKSEKISIGKDIKMNLKGNDYLLDIKGKEYLLRLNNRKKENENYDIIDFVNKEADGFYIINYEIYCY